MNTETFERRTLILEAQHANVETVNGIKTIDITHLPAMECFVCDWVGQSYELDSETSSGNPPEFSCPGCSNQNSLQEIRYEHADNGNVYKVEQTLERAVQIPATANKHMFSNVFVELTKAGQSFIEGAAVAGFEEPKTGSFRIKPSGEMQFLPPKDYIGVVSVKIKLAQNERSQIFILRFCIRSDAAILGEN